MEEKTINDEILTYFKKLNNINDSTNDELYKAYIEKSIMSICNLTNRNEFVKELKFVVVDMLNDFYTINIKASNSSSTDDNQYIKSLSEEGRNVTFSNISEAQALSLISTDISSKLDIRRNEIYRYRLLYKVASKNEKN